MSINTDGAELLRQRISELEQALSAGVSSHLGIVDHICEIKLATSLNEYLALLLARYGKEAVAVALDEELQKL